MHAVATRAPRDRRLHQTGLQAYWRAVDAALAEEATAIEAAARAALAAAQAALADAVAEHADLLARIEALETTRGEVAAAPAARSDAASVVFAPDDAAGEESAPAADDAGTASTGTPDGAGSTIPVAGQDAEPRDAVASTARVTQADQEQSMKRADADVEAGADRPAAATAQAAATRRHAALAALDERLAPVRAQRAEAEVALASLDETNADRRGDFCGVVQGHLLDPARSRLRSHRGARLRATGTKAGPRPCCDCTPRNPTRNRRTGCSQRRSACLTSMWPFWAAAVRDSALPRVSRGRAFHSA